MSKQWCCEWDVHIICIIMLQQFSFSDQVQRSCPLVHGGSWLTAQQEMDSFDYWQKNWRENFIKYFFLANFPTFKEISSGFFAHELFSLKLANMIQAIKDLANAFVPSGKLIELVDVTLVSDISFTRFHFP